MHFPPMFKIFTSSSLWKYLTIEPALFFYFTTFILLELLNTNLYLQKSCRNVTETEPNLHTSCDDEKKGILFVSSVNSSYQYVVLTIMFLYATLISSWSDGAGKRRRPLIILPIIGQLIQTTANTLHSYFWYWPPLAVVISDAATKCLFGGHILMLLGSQIYLCDVTNVQNRTLRIGIFTALKIICLPIGSGVAGFMIQGLGFFYSYLICFALTAISLVLVFIFVTDVSIEAENKSIFSFFNILQIVDGFKVVFGKKPGKQRLIVLLLVATHVIMWFTSEGKLNTNWN